MHYTCCIHVYFILHVLHYSLRRQNILTSCKAVVVLYVAHTYVVL